MYKSFFLLCSAFLFPSEILDASEQPHAVIVVGTHHYSPHLTMPGLANELERLGFRTTVINPKWDPEKDQRGLPGLEILKDADVGVFFLRFLKLNESQLSHITRFLEAGKPVVGLRTSTHAFNYPEDHPQHAFNNDFGKRALGTPYLIHLAGKTQVKPLKSASEHPILTGIDVAAWESPGSLYLVDAQRGIEPLLMGTGNSKRVGKVTNRFGTYELKKTMSAPIAWTWKNKWGGRVFTTSLGHSGDFADPNSLRVIVNGIYWASGQTVPTADTVLQPFSLDAGSSKKNSKTIPSNRSSTINGSRSLSETKKRTDRKPNVIVIVTDDQGYGDVSALNPMAKFKTPNLDRLAREGIAFTRGHSADSVCTPSRYSLLTGRYPWRTTLKRGVMGSEAKCLIPDDRMTLANLFKDNGYHTAMVGKWHLGMDFPGTREDRHWTKAVKDMPLDKGFDYFFGIPASLNYGVLAWFEGRFAKVPPTLYTKKKKNPRHLDYRIMPPYNLSKGLEVAPDFVDNQCLTRFTDKAIKWVEGKADESKSGKPFFLYLPFTSPHYPVCPLPKFHGQGDAGAYGEFVIETDFHVGRILKTLKKSGIDENTLIVFTSDNGPEKSWSVRIKDFDHDSRGALRGGKRSVYEGGHRVPFLVRWPAGIQQPGRRWKKPVGQIDLLATFADLIESNLPVSAGEDSQSFAPVLLDPKSDYNRLPLITHGNGGGEYRYAITEGDWKLVMPNPKHQIELYNLSSDRAEKKNIADQFPKKVAELTSRISRIISRGRTTDGPVQPNDTDWWEDLHWLTRQQYAELRK